MTKIVCNGLTKEEIELLCQYIEIEEPAREELIRRKTSAELALYKSIRESHDQFQKDVKQAVKWYLERKEDAISDYSKVEAEAQKAIKPKSNKNKEFAIICLLKI